MRLAPPCSREGIKSEAVAAVGLHGGTCVHACMHMRLMPLAATLLQHVDGWSCLCMLSACAGRCSHALHGAPRAARRPLPAAGGRRPGQRGGGGHGHGRHRRGGRARLPDSMRRPGRAAEQSRGRAAGTRAAAPITDSGVAHAAPIGCSAPGRQPGRARTHICIVVQQRCAVRLAWSSSRRPHQPAGRYTWLGGLHRWQCNA